MFYAVVDCLFTNSAGGTCKDQLAVRGWSAHGRIARLRHQFESQGFNLIRATTRGLWILGRPDVTWP